MRLLSGLLLVFATVGCCAQDRSKETPAYPSKDEINLVLAQAERAFDTYSAHLDVQGESLPKDQLGKDEQVVTVAKELLAALKKDPDQFNGIGGYFLIAIVQR